jgi:histidyl-tRNA synthetase
MSEEEAQGYIESVLKDSLPTSLGRRTTQQIAARLLRKVRDADDPSTFEQATATISRLAQLEGDYEAVLKEAKQIVSERGLKSSPLEELGGLFDALVQRKAQEAELVLDLGLARGFAYYTGVIFEMANSSPTPGVSLGGGGRYDGLVKALGGEEDVPALGFAFNLEPLTDTLSGGVPARSQALRSP